jgi:hypothetical protein
MNHTHTHTHTRTHTHMNEPYYHTYIHTYIHTCIHTVRARHTPVLARNSSMSRIPIPWPLQPQPHSVTRRFTLKSYTHHTTPHYTTHWPLHYTLVTTRLCVCNVCVCNAPQYGNMYLHFLQLIINDRNVFQVLHELQHHTHTHTHIYIYIYIYTYTHTYIHTYTHTHISLVCLHLFS